MNGGNIGEGGKFKDKVTLTVTGDIDFLNSLLSDSKTNYIKMKLRGVKVLSVSQIFTPPPDSELAKRQRKWNPSKTRKCRKRKRETVDFLQTTMPESIRVLIISKN